MAKIDCVLCNEKKPKWGSIKLIDGGMVCKECFNKYVDRCVLNKIKNEPLVEMTTEQCRASAKDLEENGLKKKEFKTVTLDMAHRPGQKEYERLLNEGWQVSNSNKRGALEWKPGRTDFVFEREI